MKNIILGLLVCIGGAITISACKGKASEIEGGIADYEILQKWDLPEVLNEISGIVWIDDNRIACVQDEDGIIFIYNLETSRVEDQINFGKGGDYEGIAVIGKDAYVLRSDGVIMEITGFREKDPQVTKHVTHANQLSGINIEGLCADPANNRLLMAVKERKGSSAQKEIYAVDAELLDAKSETLFTVDFSDPIFRNVKGKEKFMPGEIGIHPRTGQFYILDGSIPKLLITGKDGSSEELFILKPGDFGNPEGLTFSPEGELYISNEAESAPANILKVSLNRK